MNWLYYLAEANIYLGVFYLAYCLFLNRDTHYQLNRAYLIFSCIVSFILPVLQIGVLTVKPAEHVNTINYAGAVQAVKSLKKKGWPSAAKIARASLEATFALKHWQCGLSPTSLCLLALRATFKLENAIFYGVSYKVR
jgi:hypothetical protein